MLRSASLTPIRLGGCYARVRQHQQQQHHVNRLRKSPLSSKSSSPQQDESIFSSALAWYSTKLDTHPMITKCITSGLISAAGDAICQSLTLPDQSNEKDAENTKNMWDVQRTSRFAILGALWVGPVLHFWYGTLFQMFSKRVLARVVVDQFAFSPIFVTSFLSLLWTWEGEKPANLAPRLQENIPSILVANWTLWIPAQVLNFHFVPVKYQVLFSNFVALAWNAYLSYTSHESKPPTEVIL